MQFDWISSCLRGSSISRTFSIFSIEFSSIHEQLHALINLLLSPNTQDRSYLEKLHQRSVNVLSESLDQLLLDFFSSRCPRCL